MNRLISCFLLLSNSIRGADFERFFPTLIHLEGILFTVTQYDRGGATKFGVTLKRYKQYCAYRKIEVLICDKNKDGKVDERDLQVTVLNDVKPIYHEAYWDFVRASEIHRQCIAELFVDLIVNSGTGYKNCHTKALQRIVGVQPDGVIGQKTIAAINKSPPQKVYNRLYRYRLYYYQTRSREQVKAFGKGWKNRLIKLKTKHQNEKFT